MTDSEAHFDVIAKKYDFWKNKNAYYYRNLINLYRSLIPPQSSVLEIGCGTGDIITKLDVKEGKGIDISGEMIEIAKQKHVNKKNILFLRENIIDSNALFQADYICLADVLEHVQDLPYFIQHLSRRVSLKTTIIISVANPIWEPLLMLTEKLHMKMPEGPHRRYSVSETEVMFAQANLKVKERSYRLLIPKAIPGSDWLNARFYRNSLLEKFGFVVYWVLSK